jgi:hypothetical protein
MRERGIGEPATTLYRCSAGRAATFGSEGFMDTDARRRLIEKALAMLEEGSTLSVVSLEDFFEGNTDEESIGVNLPKEKHIGLAGFQRTLTSIGERPDVQGVFLELTEIPDPDDEADADIWPTACVAFVVTSASLGDVSEWFALLHPRDICEGWCVLPGVKPPIADAEQRPSVRPVRVWLL